MEQQESDQNSNETPIINITKTQTITPHPASIYMGPFTQKPTVEFTHLSPEAKACLDKFI